MKTNIIIIIILLFFIFFTQLNASFDSPQVGAKATALSEAYCSVGDNVTTIYYNPAGLGQFYNNQLFLSFISLYHGLDDFIYNGTVNFALHNLNMGVFATGWYGLFTDLYQENVITFSYGNRFFKTLLGNSGDRLYLGVNFKILHKNYKETGYTKFDPVFNKGMSKMGISFDAGLLYRFHNHFTVGFSIFNSISSDMGLASKSRVPVIYNIGISYDFANIFYKTNSNINRRWLNKFNFIIGGRIREKEYRLSPALEMLFFNIINFNAGYSFGEKRFRKFTTGLGFIKRYHFPSRIEKRINGDNYDVIKIKRCLNLLINYSFVYYLNGAHQFTYGNHYIEVGIQF